ncbi:hypothetical protein AAFN86_08660 [Roseomonas sp. CAU 1739]|uniref:hypothetical protein n=1 Tax=Roseomonas sp. CAU 1739 TaxID=3140364 RepID=UPI00325A6D31
MRLGLVTACMAVLGALAAVSVRAQPGDEGRCWVAIRVTGPEAMRVSEEEAEERLRIRCRAGDVVVFRTDVGLPVGGLAARYCDMTRPILIERTIEALAPGSSQAPGQEPGILAVCTYRGAPRVDR